MARTVEEGFRIFLGRLTPTGVESGAAKKHRASIAACLSNNFGITRFFRAGSFGNGTSISGFSDVDYFASVPREYLHDNSERILIRVRKALSTRFPYTAVTVRKPAVLVPFGKDKSEWTEVVPADFIKKGTNGFHIYEINDGSIGWTKSSPEAHNAYVAYVDNKLGKKVKPLVRFVKAWKYYSNVPISSFYLELLIARYASNEDAIIYPLDVKNVFHLLMKNKLASIQDPMGISGYIHPCSSPAKKLVALLRLKSAFVRATKAYQAEQNNKIGAAFCWWNLLYGHKFPAYR